MDLTRRQVLAGASGALLLAGCAPLKGVWGESQEGEVHTLDDVLGQNPFYVAHRGSADNWTEHTLYAYMQSAAVGAKAIEVSVSATADGVLVCHHDVDLRRMTGEDVEISEATYDSIRSLRNDAQRWLGPGAQLEPIATLEDVCDALAATHVLFIEDKQGTNTEALLDLMDRYPDSRQHFVWKQRADWTQHHAAAGRGYATWGYFDEDVLDRIDELASRFDMLGITHQANDALIASLVAQSRPVIVWAVHTRWMRDRLLGLGVAGLMCANIPYVSTDVALQSSDMFGTGLRQPGDLPWLVDRGWGAQPTIDPAGALVTFDGQGSSSYCMGSMCPLPEAPVRLDFEMRWPEDLPAESEHAGIAFGQDDDSPYRVHVASDVGGYHMVMRGSGRMDLFSRAPGRASGTLLDSATTDAPEPGTWMRFRVEMTDYNVSVVRTDGSSRRVTSYDRTYRGGYFSLTRNYAEGPSVQFRAISVA